MFSSARKFGAACVILTAINITGLIMAALILIGSELPFSWIIGLLIYLISGTALGLVLTLGLRSIAQDSETEAESSAILIKKLKTRIEELEKIQK